MKVHLSAVALACLALTPLPASSQAITAPPPAAQGATPEQLLDALITHSRHSARLENGRLTGEGADFLRELGQNSQFVMVGEQHGVANIAQFARAYWRELNPLGFNYAVSESDPWVTEALERELRAGGVPAWTTFMHEHGGAVAAPFYNWVEESEWVDEVVRTSHAPRGAPRIWGVDQVFIGAAAWQMRDLAANARNAEARALATELLTGSEEVTWFSSIDRTRLEALRALLNGRRDARYAEMVDAMIVSHHIYQPFTGGGGEANLANIERENLMRQLFLENYNRAVEAGDEAPRVMFKMGGSHMFRGASPTQIQAFGGFVTEFAAAHGTQATTIMALCAQGGLQSSAFAPPADCTTDDYRSSWGFIDQYVDPTAVTIFDLRAWRLRPRRWNTLPFNVQQAILSFDVLVIVPAGSGAALLPGLTQPAPPRPRS